MKKFLSTLLAVFLTLCLALSFAGCTSFYCNPKGKAWYNWIAFPSIANPYNEIYDGSYSIEIDKKGNVVFKTLDGEELKGTLSTSPSKYRLEMDVDIVFENGKTAHGYCEQDKYGRTLRIYYGGNSYVFGEKQQLSKEEMLAYRGEFIQFLTNVYQTGVFPTEEEIKNNQAYQKYTGYIQIDSCCGGPFVYDTLEKANIEKIEPIENNINSAELTLEINGTSVVCPVWNETNVTLIKDGAFEKGAFSDIRTGECLILPNRYYSSGEEIHSISSIFYFE